MIDCNELLRAWASIRPHIPDEHGKYKAFCELVELLENDGWDQAGYLFEENEFSEVVRWCQMNQEGE